MQMSTCGGRPRWSRAGRGGALRGRALLPASPRPRAAGTARPRQAASPGCRPSGSVGKGIRNDEALSLRRDRPALPPGCRGAPGANKGPRGPAGSLSAAIPAHERGSERTTPRGAGGSAPRSLGDVGSGSHPPLCSARGTELPGYRGAQEAERALPSSDLGRRAGPKPRRRGRNGDPRRVSAVPLVPRPRGQGRAERTPGVPRLPAPSVGVFASGETRAFPRCCLRNGSVTPADRLSRVLQGQINGDLSLN